MRVLDGEGQDLGDKEDESGDSEAPEPGRFKDLNEEVGAHACMEMLALAHRLVTCMRAAYHW